MRVLILSVSAGGGHGHAAEAIKEHVLQNEPDSEVKIVDTLKYINPIIDKVVIGSYLKTLKITPSLYGKLYNYSESDSGVATISNKFNEILTLKLEPLIDEFNPEIIVCTHPFSSEMMSIMKSKKKLNVPTITTLTDYASHSFWIHPHMDAYVVSNADMIDEMVEKEVPSDIIYDYGIPVKSEFNAHFDREKTLKELGLNPSKKTLMIMGGSLGMGNIPLLYSELAKVKSDIQLIVITGSNSKLYDELLEISADSTKTTRVIGFTNNVNKYMQASDLLFTKPGGLTITEALICNTPMALFSPIPGHEEKNADFLLRHNLAIDLWDIKMTCPVIEAMLNNPKHLEVLKNNCSRFAKPNCGYHVYELMKRLIDENHSKLQAASTTDSIVQSNATQHKEISDSFLSVTKFSQKSLKRAFEKFILNNAKSPV